MRKLKLLLSRIVNAIKVTYPRLKKGNSYEVSYIITHYKSGELPIAMEYCKQSVFTIDNLLVIQNDE